ncbi:ABC transporter substrate-binding protein [Halorubrum ezzemoulense]|uniref:ABC transporter substrate-binding protein n=1 Tax=Halorubrum ezzemoulense TaxID=337243 RepID=UPI00233147DC|nr:ABC transporter substrate-binding protein [Halorubrum ezzemoulense]MDB9278430.1 ABC transporter substrate-binding protein [Halorubrum ezzemoulense]MDB9282370.1 ABC transporter substrate-binding protein [Halorubrum ezzemoulense]
MSRNTTGMTDRRTLLKLTGGAGLVGLSGCLSTTDDGSDGSDGSDGGDGGDSTEAYEIGMVDSQTGSLSAFGERNQRGVDLALSMVNEVGINGRDLDIVVEDSESENQGGIAAAQKLVNQDGVPFLIGAVGSGVSLAIYESVIEGTDVVQLSQNSTGLNLTEFPGLLRMSPSGRSQSLALSNLISDDGYDEVAITYVNNDYGQSLTDAFVDAYEGEVVYNTPHDQDQQSYSSVISEMNSSGADAWLFITYQAEFATMVNEVFSSGYEAQFYGADSVSGDNVLENTPEGSTEGMKIVVPSAPVEEENYQSFADTFESEYGRQPTSWAAYAYDCVINAALAIQAADEFTGAALQDTVRRVSGPEGETVTSFEAASGILADGGGPDDVDYQGVSGPIDFDENGDPVGFLQVLEVQDHAYEGIDFIEG